MKQYTQAQVLQARKRATSEVIQALIDGNSDVLNHPVLVPETGCATWNHYFFCPDHSVRLLWDRHSPHQHRCPVDGATFSGEPYDGAWWRWLNGLNAKASYELAVLWLLTEDSRYLHKVKEILLAYARYYPGYEEHGGIPYNGPGKANAQTLCEANCHTDFARGFDIVRSALTGDEESYIARRLLREGAEFLMKHRCHQIHNHEVKIGSAIGIIGAVLEDERYLDFAVNSPYGLRYQLQHALLPDGLWFEGSLHYHFYALQGFFAFEKVAAGTSWSLLEEPFYQRMLSLPLSMLMPDMTLPKMNDCVHGQENVTQTDLYEFAWWHYANPLYGSLLKTIYSHRERNNIDALFYGRALPEQAATVPEDNYHSPQSSLTIIRNVPGRAVGIKHTPYGGEHDHYDRLGLMVFNNGKALFPDLGTTGYGAPLHYGYYKNSFAHNTLCIEGKNQPPASPRVVHWHNESGVTQLVTEVDWKTKVVMPDSKTRVEWDEEAYRDVVFRRDVSVKEDLLIDIITVENPHCRVVDSIRLIAGKCISSLHNCADTPVIYPHVRCVAAQPVHEPVSLVYQTPEPVSLTCFATTKSTLLRGRGPDNPSTSELEYLVLRSEERRMVHVTITDFMARKNLRVAVDNGALVIFEGNETLHHAVFS